MGSIVISLLLIIVGFVNFMPVVGLFSAERLRQLYGLEFEEKNLVILMRHRALLFGLIGGLMMVSAFRPELQSFAIGMGFVSMIGFVVLARLEGAVNEHLRKVVWVDVVASILLVIVLILYQLK